MVSNIVETSIHLLLHLLHLLLRLLLHLLHLLLRLLLRLLHLLLHLLHLLLYLLHLLLKRGKSSSNCLGNALPNWRGIVLLCRLEVSERYVGKCFKITMSLNPYCCFIAQGTCPVPTVNTGVVAWVDNYL